MMGLCTGFEDSRFLLIGTNARSSISPARASLKRPLHQSLTIKPSLLVFHRSFCQCTPPPPAAQTMAYPE